MRAGELFEVIDRDAATVTAQLLGTTATTVEHLGDLRPVLGAVPSGLCLLRPREVTMTRGQLPVAIFALPGLTPLRDRAPELLASLGRTEAVATLFAWFAAMATDLDRVHTAKLCHGAIRVGQVVVGPGPLERCYLVGFGLDALARKAGSETADASTRRDLVDLLGALHDLFVVLGTAPDGGAAAKWTLLRHSAQHGEHPALASGVELGKTLVELGKLSREPNAPMQSMRPPRSSGTLPPPRTSSGRSATMPPPRNPSSTAREEAAARAGSPRVSRVPPPPPEAPSGPSRKPVFIAVGVLVVAAVAGGVLVLNNREAPTTSPPRVAAPVRAPRPALRCEGESLAPAAGFETAATEFDVDCAPDAHALVAVVRDGTAVRLATRDAVRGHAWTTEPTPLGSDVAEIGVVAAAPGGLWVPWRNRAGDPFGLAEVSLPTHARSAVAVSGWDAVPLRGVMLLHRDDANAWLLSNVESDGGSHPVLFQAVTNPARGRAPVQTWYLGAGTVEAVAPGPSPVLLFHQRDGRTHRLSALTLDLGAVAAARAPDDATSVRGANPPESALQRSAAVTLEGDAIAFVPRGARSGSSVAFALSAGAALPADQCHAGSPCAGPGPVHLLRFGSAGPVDTVVSADAVVRDVDADGGDRWLVLLETAPGAPAAALHLGVVAGSTVESRELQAFGVGPAQAVVCNGSTWLARRVTQPTPRVAVVPVDCLTPRAMTR